MIRKCEKVVIQYGGGETREISCGESGEFFLVSAPPGEEVEARLDVCGDSTRISQMLAKAFFRMPHLWPLVVYFMRGFKPAV
jgi:hypothetical protein